MFRYYLIHDICTFFWILYHWISLLKLWGLCFSQRLDLLGHPSQDHFLRIHCLLSQCNTLLDSQLIFNNNFICWNLAFLRIKTLLWWVALLWYLVYLPRWFLICGIPLLFKLTRYQWFLGTMLYPRLSRWIDMQAWDLIPVFLPSTAVFTTMHRLSTHLSLLNWLGSPLLSNLFIFSLGELPLLSRVLGDKTDLVDGSIKHLLSVCQYKVGHVLPQILTVIFHPLLLLVS